MQEDERRAEAERKSAQARMEIQNTAKMYQRRAEAELKSAQVRMDIQNAAKTQQPEWEKAFIETMNRVSPTLPRPDAANTANPYIDKGLVSAAMPNVGAGAAGNANPYLLPGAVGQMAFKDATGQQQFSQTMNTISPMFQRADAVQTTNPHIEKGMVSGAMPNTAIYPYKGSIMEAISPPTTGNQFTDTNIETSESETGVFTNKSQILSDKQRLEDEITEIQNAYRDIPKDYVKPWDTVMAATWQVDKRLFRKNNDIVDGFKAYFLYGYRNIVRAAAQKYDIPVELLAGVVWNEVGGDPAWFDPAAYFVRSRTTPYIPEEYWGKVPARLANSPEWIGSVWSEATKDPAKTSFGDVSMQIRVAAETLGISPEKLNAAMEKRIINALQNPEFSIFIAAKHLANLKNVDFSDIPYSKLTMDQIATIASRYNIGAGASFERAAEHSYGKAVKRHLPFIMEYCLQD